MMQFPGKAGYYYLASGAAGNGLVITRLIERSWMGY